MHKGIVIKGGGRNKISGGSIDIDGKDSIAIEMEDTSDNGIKNVKISLRDSIEKFEEMREVILSIEDSSINPKTNNKYQIDALNKIPDLTKFTNEATIPSTTILALISLLSNWITIQTVLAPQLAPYIIYLTSLLGVT